MATSDNTAARQELFIDQLNELETKDGSGKVAIQAGALTGLVRRDPDSAVRIAQGYARLATQDRAFAQRAVALGAAYEAVFDDDLLTEEVASILTANGLSVPQLNFAPGI
jgi:hypothetical protein